MVTILDVAQRAGVGVGTVSRVINDSPHVSDATRAKVQAVIEELGYRPSTVARALSSGRSSTIAVIAPHATRPSVVERLRGIIDVIGTDEYDLTLCSVQSPAQREFFINKHATLQRATGAILVSTDVAQHELEAFADSEVPVVVLDHEAEGAPSVVIDDHAAGALAAEHLISLGHRRIGLVGDTDTGDYRSRASVQRQHGFRGALLSAGISEPTSLERTGDHSEHSAHVEASALLKLDEPPTAIFATSDTSAIGVLQAARELGKAVPEELSVLGFDDLWVARLFELSTVSQPLYESGVTAARILLDMVAGNEVAQRTELPVRLVVRTTTAPPS